METKRLITAVVLAALVFIAWNFISIKMGWIPEQPVVSSNATATDPDAVEILASPSATDPGAPAPSQAQSSLALQSGFVPNDPATVTIKTPYYKAVFSRQGGVLQEYLLLEYNRDLGDDAHSVGLISPEAARQAPLALLVNGTPSWKQEGWEIEGSDLNLAEGEQGTISFVGYVNDMKVKRTFVFSGSSYTFDEAIHLESDEAKRVNIALTVAGTPTVMARPGVFSRVKHFIFGGTPPQDAESPYNMTRVAWLQGKKFSESKDKKDLSSGILISDDVTWMGVMNNYFIGMVSMPGVDTIGKAGYVDGVYTSLVGKTNLLVTKEQPINLNAVYLLGPKEARVMASAPNDMGKALDYGFFTVIAKPMVYMLDFFYKFVGNYGVAIILMTIVVRIILWPLAQKSFKSMEGMRKIQPLMAEIREKYGDDKEAMNKEIMAAYKRHKINPAGGCLPIFLQLPIFLGLYNALLNAIEIRHAHFISYIPFTDIPWLMDLSAPDPYLITPLLMGATMFFQQRMSPPPGDPTQAKVMMFMPIIFTLFFLGFPSGLVLYWLVSNVLAVAQQQWLRRKSGN